MIEGCVINTPIGGLAIYEKDGTVVHVKFVDDKLMTPKSVLLQNAVKQFDEYFNGVRHEFDLPMRPHGTDFQKKVWECLRAIPYGETITYGQLAALIGKPGASRAVGNANGRNPLPLIIPCHRVVASGGGLGGFSCGIWRKEYLLGLEKSR